VLCIAVLTDSSARSLQSLGGVTVGVCCCQLYEDERRSASQLQTQLADVRREMSDLRTELDRLRSVKSASAADANNDRRVTVWLIAAAHPRHSIFHTHPRLMALCPGLPG